MILQFYVFVLFLFVLPVFAYASPGSRGDFQPVPLDTPLGVIEEGCRLKMTSQALVGVGGRGSLQTHQHYDDPEGWDIDYYSNLINMSESTARLIEGDTFSINLIQDYLKVYSVSSLDSPAIPRKILLDCHNHPHNCTVYEAYMASDRTGAQFKLQTFVVAWSPDWNIPASFLSSLQYNHTLEVILGGARFKFECPY